MTDMSQIGDRDHLERVTGEVDHPNDCQPGFAPDKAPKPKQAGPAPLTAQIYPQTNPNFTQEVFLYAR
ncbi:MAG TPA: hypothetical protein VII23_13465 [Terriglobales bacterium]